MNTVFRLGVGFLAYHGIALLISAAENHVTYSSAARRGEAEHL
jgi:hypothetical protein